MPVTKHPMKQLWRIGSGAYIYKSKAAAERAYRAYLAKKEKKR